MTKHAPHAGRLPFRSTTLITVCVPGKVVLAALSTLPVPRLGVNTWLLKTIPALLHEEARPVLPPVLGAGIPIGVGGAQLLGLWGYRFLFPH